MKSTQRAHFETDDPEGFSSEDLATMSKQVPKGTKFTFGKIFEGPVAHWEATATWDALGTPTPLYTQHKPGTRGSIDMREVGNINPTYEGPGGVGSQER